MNYKSLIAFAILLSITVTGFADEFLTGTQIKELFSDRTYDIEKIGKNSKNHLKSYTGAEGLRLVYIPWKSKISKRKWWVEENKFCGSHPKKGDFCREIKVVGNGTYHSFTAGVHQSTLRNFREGKHL